MALSLDGFAGAFRILTNDEELTDNGPMRRLAANDLTGNGQWGLNAQQAPSLGVEPDDEPCH